MGALLTYSMLVPSWVRELKMGFRLYAVSSFSPPLHSQIEKRIESATTVKPATFCFKTSDRLFNLLWCLLARLRANPWDLMNSRCFPSCRSLPHALFDTLTVRSQYFNPHLDFISNFRLGIIISSQQLELQQTT
jgi:hypothetical protein